jgi:branched-chain amino acid transport system permease protein
MMGFFVTVGILACFQILLAAGLNIQFGFGGLANFGIVGFFAVGAYATAMAMADPSEAGDLVFAWGLPWWCAALIALTVAAVSAGMLALTLLRTDIEPLFIAVITLSFAQILYLVIVAVEGVANGFIGISGLDRLFEDRVSAANYELAFLGVMLVAVTLVIGFTRYLQSTPYGRILKATRDEPRAAEALGHNVRSYRVTAFVLGSIIMALAGALWVPYLSTIEPSAILSDRTFLVFAALVIGGAGNAWGSLVGGVLVSGVIWEGSRFLPRLFDWLDSDITTLRGIVIGLLFIWFLRFRPEGIVRERERRLKDSTGQLPGRQLVGSL